MNYLKLGWHELRIDLVDSRPIASGPAFIVEGRVLRSTYPGFAGQRFAYIANMRNKSCWSDAMCLAEASRSSEVMGVFRHAVKEVRKLGPNYYAEVTHPMHGAVVPSSNPDGVVVLANCQEKRFRHLPNITIIRCEFCAPLSR